MKANKAEDLESRNWCAQHFQYIQNIRCTFLYGSSVNLQDLPDAGSWSTVLAQKQGKYTKEVPSNENKQTNKLKLNEISSCFISSLPSPRPNYERRSAALPGILKFFKFLLSVRDSRVVFLAWAHSLPPT